jgi:hypothetical protein
VPNSIVCRILCVDLDLRCIKYLEFLAELFFLETVDSSHFDYPKHLGGELIILVLEVTTLLFGDVIEQDRPYLLSPIELENRAEVHLDYVRSGKDIFVLWLHFLSLLLPATEVKASTTSSATAATKELLENIVHILAAASTTTSLLLLSDSLFSKLVIGASLIWITERLIGIC